MELKIPGLTVRLEVVLASIFIGFVAAMMTFRSCSKISFQEGMEMMTTAYTLSGDGPQTINKSTPIDMTSTEPSTMSKWVGDAHAYSQSMGDGYQSVMDRTKQHSGTDVNADTMVFYRDNEFKPECCPSSYSNSTGCMCMSNDQVKHLAMRAGNRATSCGGDF